MTEGFQPFEYVKFIKSCHGARFPLTGSGVAEVPLEEIIGGAFPRIELASLATSFCEFQARIAVRYAVPERHAFPALATSGAAFLAMSALSTQLPQGAAIAVERPGYGVFETVARFLGRRVIHVDRRMTQGCAIDVDAVEHAFRGGARVFCVTDLHNPTGAALTADDVAGLDAAARRHDAWIVSNEVYRDFRPGGVGTNYRDGGRVIAISSLTKCYGLGGLRAGFVFAPPGVIERLEEIEEIAYGFAPAATVSLSATALTKADALLERGRAFATAGRPVMDAWIAATPHVSWTPPAAGVTGLVKIDGVTDSKRFAARLREELDVQVVPGAYFGAEGHIRVSFGRAPKDVGAALDVLGMGLRALRQFV